jgi:hypothetical protein
MSELNSCSTYIPGMYYTAFKRCKSYVSYKVCVHVDLLMRYCLTIWFENLKL